MCSDLLMFSKFSHEAGAVTKMEPICLKCRNIAEFFETALEP